MNVLNRISQENKTLRRKGRERRGFNKERDAFRSLKKKKKEEKPQKRKLKFPSQIPRIFLRGEKKETDRYKVGTPKSFLETRGKGYGSEVVETNFRRICVFSPEGKA